MSISAKTESQKFPVILNISNVDQQRQPERLIKIPNHSYSEAESKDTFTKFIHKFSENSKSERDMAISAVVEDVSLEAMKVQLSFTSLQKHAEKRLWKYLRWRSRSKNEMKMLGNIINQDLNKANSVLMSLPEQYLQDRLQDFEQVEKEQFKFVKIAKGIKKVLENFVTQIQTENQVSSLKKQLEKLLEESEHETHNKNQEIRSVNSLGDLDSELSSECYEVPSMSVVVEKDTGLKKKCDDQSELLKEMRGEIAFYFQTQADQLEQIKTMTEEKNHMENEIREIKKQRIALESLNEHYRITILKLNADNMRMQDIVKGFIRNGKSLAACVELNNNLRHSLAKLEENEELNESDKEIKRFINEFQRLVSELDQGAPNVHNIKFNGIEKNQREVNNGMYLPNMTEPNLPREEFQLNENMKTIQIKTNQNLGKTQMPGKFAQMKKNAKKAPLKKSPFDRKDDSNIEFVHEDGEDPITNKRKKKK